MSFEGEIDSYSYSLEIFVRSYSGVSRAMMFCNVVRDSTASSLRDLTYMTSMEGLCCPHFRSVVSHLKIVRLWVAHRRGVAMYRYCRW